MAKKAAKFRNAETNNNPKKLFWEISEYEKKDREPWWYYVAGLVAVALVTWSIYQHDYIFTFIIIISTFIFYLYESQESLKVNFFMDNNGITVGRRTRSYSDFHRFFIIYRPQEKITNLYLEFNGLKHRLTIPLYDQNPIIIRQFLLKYLPEDKDRDTEPLAESVAKLLKL